MIEEFAEKLCLLKPRRSKLMSEGYNEEQISKIYSHEFNLEKTNSTIVTSLIDDFIGNYAIDNFRVHNLFFSYDIENDSIRGHTIFGFIEGGYISFDRETKRIYASYADDIQGSISLICIDDNSFFKILLIVAEYSSKSYEGIEIDEDELEETYIDRCQELCPRGDFYSLFI